MRIITGKYKNISIDAPLGDNTRPTKDMVKEALFSSLGIFNGNEIFLDLFGGSGAVAFEALSRGVKSIYINDIDYRAYSIIKKNARKFEGNINIYNMNYVSLLNSIENRFDYIFIDPPYKFDDFDNLFKIITDRKLLKDDGIVIFETAKETILNDIYYDMYLYKNKRYGITKLNYFKKETQ